MTHADWADWRAEHPETHVRGRDTGFELNYEHYTGKIGFFEHYWTREDVIQPGVRTVESELLETAAVCRVSGDAPGEIHLYPVERVRERELITDTIAGRAVVAVVDSSEDVVVHAAPPLLLDREGETLVDAEDNT